MIQYKPDGTKVTKEFTVTENGGIKLTIYDTSQSEAKIPATIEFNGKLIKVNTIGKGSFAGNKNLEKVTIGKYITTIGKNAFRGDSNLKDITIKSGNITHVSKNAFKGIAKDAVIKIKASKKKFKEIVAMIKASGISKTVTFERIK